MSTDNMGPAAYRTNAQIAEEIPPMPKERKPWPIGRKLLVWLVFCAGVLDVGFYLATGGYAGLGTLVIVHAIAFGGAGVGCILNEVKL